MAVFVKAEPASVSQPRRSPAGPEASGKLARIRGRRSLPARTRIATFGRFERLWDLTRKLFARLVVVSERAVADWEDGKLPGQQARQRLAEIRRLHDGLASVMEPGFVGEWLQTPNTAFGDLKPLEVVERGEVDRLWRMIFTLESGVPA